MEQMRVFSDVYTLDLSIMSWSRLALQPHAVPALYGHSCHPVPGAEHRVLVFGGMAVTGYPSAACVRPTRPVG